MRIFIEPADLLSFRTGRPFDAGQDNFAESLFPPTLETIQGAVRATIAAYWDPKKDIAEAFKEPQLVELIGNQSSYGRFQITGYTLGRYTSQKQPESENNVENKVENNVERLFPAPSHIMKTGPEGKEQFYRLTPRKLEKTVCTNFPNDIKYYLAPERRPGEDLAPLEGWITETDLKKTLGKDDISKLEVIKARDIYQEESRVGIEIERKTRATKDKMWYQMIMIRMNYQQDQKFIYGFVVDIQFMPEGPGKEILTGEAARKALNFPKSGWMTIGGEQRAAHFRVLPPEADPQDKQNSLSTRAKEHSLLYLATPADFEQGWQPGAMEQGLDRPITAAISRYEAIGGWKMDPQNTGGGANKSMRRCVPAGSVYFYDRRIVAPTSLTDYNQQIGYGICHEGEW